MTSADARAFLAEHHWGVLVTLRRPPQLSDVANALIDGLKSRRKPAVVGR